MRPYRAIPIDGKDFVYGWYVKCRGEHYILPLHNPDDPKSSFDERWIQEGADEDGWFEVIPETVGQQVGIKDKDDKEIYKGDILLNDIDSDCMPGQKFVVKYLPGHFVAGGILGAGDHIGQDCKVIGNIHQHPNLLEQDNG